MPAWQVAYAMSTAKALLPFQRQLHALKRELRPARTTVVQDWAIDNALDQIACLTARGVSVQGASVMEIGSGWYPVVPLVYRAAGASQVALTDAHHLLHLKTLSAAVEHVAGRAGLLAERLAIPEAEVLERIQPPTGLGFPEAMSWLGFSYLAPLNAANAPMTDIVCSHTVFEHIRPADLKGLLQTLRGRLKQGGVMIHGVDHSDHRSHVDPSLTLIDFLRYSDRLWDRIHINPQDYTNRLRHSEYLNLFDEAGYEATVASRWISEKTRTRLHEVPLWGRFRDMEIDEILTTWTQYVLEPRQEERISGSPL